MTVKRKTNILSNWVQLGTQNNYSTAFSSKRDSVSTQPLKFIFELKKEREKS